MDPDAASQPLWGSLVIVRLISNPLWDGMSQRLIKPMNGAWIEQLDDEKLLECVNSVCSDDWISDGSRCGGSTVAYHVRGIVLGGLGIYRLAILPTRGWSKS